MDILLCALALLSGVVGAGFASGREIVRFFACHGWASGIAILGALTALAALFLRLCSQMAHGGVSSLPALCRLRWGKRFAALCSALFVLLCAMTGGAMLSACAELFALTLPLRHAYALGMGVTLALALVLSASDLHGLALVGAALCALLPFLLLSLLRLPVGEACFEPVLPPDSPLRALTDGVLYGALNAAMLAGELPLLLSLSREKQKRSVALFCLLFGAMLLLGVSVCRRHMQSILLQPLPFVWLSRSLGAGGYRLIALCLYAAALSTLCATLCAAVRLLLPAGRRALRLGLACLFSLLFARLGFGRIVQSAYPILGAVCAALLLLLCLPLHQKVSMSDR